MKKSDENGLAVMGCFGLLVSVPLACVLRGYVLSAIWGWFIVAAFHVPALGIAQAIGVSIVVSMLTHQREPKSDDEWYVTLGSAFAIPLFVLAFSYLVKMFL